MSGDVDIFSASPGSVAGLIESGDVLPLVYYSEDRHSTMPDTPTLAGLGYVGEDVCIGGYFWIRSSAPEEAKDFLNDLIEENFTDDVIARLEQRLNMDVRFVGREELAGIVPGKYEQWTGLCQGNLA